MPYRKIIARAIIHILPLSLSTPPIDSTHWLAKAGKDDGKSPITESIVNAITTGHINSQTETNIAKKAHKKKYLFDPFKKYINKLVLLSNFSCFI